MPLSSAQQRGEELPCFERPLEFAEQANMQMLFGQFCFFPALSGLPQVVCLANLLSVALFLAQHLLTSVSSLPLDACLKRMG